MTRVLLVVFALLYLAMIVLALRPATDIAVAALFHEPAGFVGATPAGVAARYVAWATPFLLLAALTTAWLAARAGRLAPRRAPSGRALVVLAAAMALGPGLVVHAGLKELSHRPRPVATLAFGGPDAFRPWYRFDGACRHNCSFASGETAAAGWTIAAAALTPPPFGAPALAAALVFTVVTGVWRMALGAHWMSDVSGAALIMVIAALFCRATWSGRHGAGRIETLDAAAIDADPTGSARAAGANTGLER